ncbi:sigma factor-like helix-turn-helix DNA-binding protein [Aureimonas sp. ME7]|uniref:sigma factor-like helix-turn-helix DNA-binding protein n=1 Tax=Aureimonas sp. ME7 TaxID=2744252 RepID=UPI0015F5D441|nr:sigma factor-like helix-turn-helix DNA-binding protein [Aureimonas sp. ME7]
MPTLKEFEEALKEYGLRSALDVLDTLRKRDKDKRAAAPARRVTGRKMTPDVARQILHLHETTGMTQQEIAFQLGVNQGRVNEVIKRGKWLTDNPDAPEAKDRDAALQRMKRPAARPPAPASVRAKRPAAKAPVRKPPASPQLSLGDF